MTRRAAFSARQENARPVRHGLRRYSRGGLYPRGAGRGERKRRRNAAGLRCVCRRRTHGGHGDDPHMAAVNAVRSKARDAVFAAGGRRLCPLSARRRRGAAGQRCAEAMPKPVRAALRMRRSGIWGRGAGRFAAAHADGGNAAEPESAARYRRGLVLGPTRPLRPLRRG